MKRFLAIAAGAVLLVILGILVVASRQPPQFRVTRSVRIDTGPEKVFSLINDFHQWEHWSPWAKLDPAMRVDFEGSPAGVGARYHWEGNAEVGEGRMTVTESVTNERVQIRLEFVRPIEALNLTEFVLRPDGGATQVEWSMSGTNNLPAKVFALFMDMDRMVGGDFEKGLAQMKARAEAGR